MAQPDQKKINNPARAQQSQSKSNATVKNPPSKTDKLEIQRLEKQLDKQQKKFDHSKRLQQTLIKISELAFSADDLQPFYGSLHDAICQLVRADNFYIALSNDERTALELAYFVDHKDIDVPSDGSPYSIELKSKTLSTLVFRTEKAMLLSADEILDLAANNLINRLGPASHSWLGVPLKVNNQTFGVMVIQSYEQDNIYESWQLELLEYVSQQVATTLQRKKAREDLEQQVIERTQNLQVSIKEHKKSRETQSALYQIANLANQDLELNQFYAALHNIIGSLVYSENFYIALKDTKNDTMNMVYYVDTMDNFNVESIASLPMETIKKSITVYVMKSGEPLLADNEQMAELTERERLDVHGVETVSWLGIPLVIGGNVIGVMTLQSYLPGQILSAQDKELMIFVGQHVAAALERNQKKDYLRTTVDQRTTELRNANQKLNIQIEETLQAQKIQTALFEITDLASTTKDMYSLYSSIHQIISYLIYAENLYICLYSEDKTQLNFVYYVDTQDYLNQETVKQIPSKDVRQTSTGLVLANGESILKTPDNRTPVNHENAKVIGKPSEYWLGVPLKIGDNVIGVLVVQSYDKKHSLGAMEQDLLEYVSQHIALTLERKQAHSALEERVKQRTKEIVKTNASLEQQIVERRRSELTQKLLYEISNLAADNIPQQDLFAKIHTSLGMLIYAEYFYIAIWNESDDDMDWVYYVDSDDDFDYDEFKNLPFEKQKKSFARLVKETKQPLLVCREGIFELEEKGDIVLIGPPPEFYLGIPLISGTQCIGVMAIQSYNEKINYTETDMTLLKFVSQSIVSAIERREHRFHLEEQVEARTLELTDSNEKLQREILQRKDSEELQTALYRISETPQQCSTEKELYAKLHEIIAQLMNAKNLYIALVDEENQCFNFDYVVDEVDKNIPDKLPIGRSITSYVYHQRKTLHVNRKEIEKLVSDGVLEFKGSDSEDWVGVPLQLGEVIYGILILQSYDKDYTYGTREIEILNFVSTHIAEALERTGAEKKLKLANEALAEKTRKAEAASEAKSAFLATVSHEIRTPMNGILGMLSLISDTSMNQKQRDYISKISISAQSLLGIINDILDYSKIEEGKLELETIEFDLVEILDNLIDIFSANVIEKELTFSIDLHENVKLQRIGDALRVSQVLINLIGNAIKFTQHGFVNLTVKSPATNRLLFIVEDTGIGIEKEKREKIFSSFTQADDTTTRKFGGSGLGLSICQQLVTMMSGSIEVAGDVGKGSLFSFEIFSPEKQAKQVEAADQKFPEVQMLLISKDSNQTSSWINFSKRFNLPLEVWQPEQLQEKSAAQKLIDKSITHIFVDDDLQNHLSFESLEKLNLITPKKTAVFLLCQPSPHLLELPNFHQEIRLIAKPTKMSVVLSLLIEQTTKQQDRKRNHEVENPNARKESRVREKLIGKKILLAEDNVINQQVAKEILRQAGAEVVIAENGQLAVEACKQQTFDLVLMDMQMPIMDGYQASEAIRRSIAFEKLPIIAMTANVMKGDKEKCLQHGMNDYIGKPINRARFFTTIEQYL